MELTDLNAVLGEVIAAESGYERETRHRPAAGRDPAARASALHQARAGEYGGQRRPLRNGWIKVSSGSEGNRAWFQVEDDGPGIKPEQREHLFQPFVRGDSARTISGTGLGLAIVSAHYR